ncbi:MAG: UvrB/UvrC motif-containing protein [Candidatus Krumholzibacteriota bacterium]|nr:UvrB/UvrC motif-containing protein [Candidatus Krumholzibacteriota bacterium]
MLCQFCKKREATIHFTNVINNQVEKIHSCPLCAEERGFDYLKKSNFEKDHFLAGLMNLSGKPEKVTSAPDCCPNCGLTFHAFRQTGRLGCSNCYEVFNRQLLPLLRSVHGNTRHLGKVPRKLSPRVNRKRRVGELKNELKRAVKEENYERAAELRDEINALQNSSPPPEEE